MGRFEKNLADITDRRSISLSLGTSCELVLIRHTPCRLLSSYLYDWSGRSYRYGQLGAGITIVTLSSAALIGGLYGVQAADKAFWNFRTNRERRQREEEIATLPQSVLVALQKQREEEAKAKAPISERPLFNDGHYKSWHNAQHWPSALLCAGIAAGVTNAARLPLSIARKDSKTFCQQGIWMAWTGATMLIGSGFAVRAADNAYAVVCKYGIRPAEAKGARIRHSESILRRSPITLLLASYNRDLR